MQRLFSEGFCWWNLVWILYIYSTYPEAVVKNATIDPLAGIEPAIPVQLSNQVSYKDELSSSSGNLMSITKVMAM